MMNGTLRSHARCGARRLGRGSGGGYKHFADTAALTDAPDLVISVDTAVAHLAGALGTTVWLLNRFDACWRWFLDRADSPWYPTMRLFRQSKPGDRDATLANVLAALGERSRAAV
jgi:hypothetical protein